MRAKTRPHLFSRNNSIELRAISTLAKSSPASLGGSKKFFRQSTGIRLSGREIEPKSRESVSCDSLHRDDHDVIGCACASSKHDARHVLRVTHAHDDDKNCEADPIWDEARRQERPTTCAGRRCTRRRAPKRSDETSKSKRASKLGLYALEF